MEVSSLLSMYNSLNTKCKYNMEDRNLAVIRSNLMYKCLILAEEENSALDTRSVCCQWCLNPLSSQTCSVTLERQKHPKKHLRSLLRKDDQSLNCFQKKLAARIRKKQMSHTMVFKCKFCSRPTSLSLRKPTDEGKKEVDKTIILQDVEKKKKKKKKDVYAGLNAGAVQSVKNMVNVNAKQPNSVKTPIRNNVKKLSEKEQSRIQRVLSQAPAPKKKPSLLAAFLDSL